MQDDRRRSLQPMMIAVLALAVLGLALSACGGSSSSSSSGSTGATEAETTEAESTEAESSEAGGSDVAEAEAAVAKDEEEPTTIASAELGPLKPPADAKIYYVSSDPSIEGSAQIKKGFEAAMAAIGYKFEGCDQRSTDPESGSQCFTNAINAKPDVIVANGISEEVAGGGYAKAKKAGIPTIAMFSGNPAGTSTVGVAEGNYCSEVGEAQADWAIAASGGDANAIIPFTNEFPCTTEAQEAMVAGLEKCAECAAEGLEFQVANVTTQLPQQIQSKLLAGSGVNTVLGTFNIPPIMAAEVVEQQGKAGEVLIGGLFGGAPNLEMIKNGGPQQAETTNGSGEPGWVAVDAAARLVAGEKVPAILPVTWMTLTEKNVAKFPKGYLGAANFEKQFEELWGK